jgi:hypothetical protein
MRDWPVLPLRPENGRLENSCVLVFTLIYAKSRGRPVVVKLYLDRAPRVLCTNMASFGNFWRHFDDQLGDGFRRWDETT